MDSLPTEPSGKLKLLSGWRQKENLTSSPLREKAPPIPESYNIVYLDMAAFHTQTSISLVDEKENIPFLFREEYWNWKNERPQKNIQLS